jgi:hypothetical protein
MRGMIEAAMLCITDSWGAPRLKHAGGVALMYFWGVHCRMIFSIAY